MERLGSEYGQSNNTAQIIARHSLWLVSSLCCALMSKATRFRKQTVCDRLWIIPVRISSISAPMWVVPPLQNANWTDQSCHMRPSFLQKLDGTSALKALLFKYNQPGPSHLYFTAQTILIRGSCKTSVLCSFVNVSFLCCIFPGPFCLLLSKYFGIASVLVLICYLCNEYTLSLFFIIPTHRNNHWLQLN